MIALYSFPTPNGHKVSIALEELELAYEVFSINIVRRDQDWPEFRRICPNGRIPAIVDYAPADRGEPISVFESGAILLYLAHKAGRLYGDGPRVQVEVNEWLMWQMAGFGPMLGQLGHFRNVAKGTDEYGTERYGEEARRLYRVLDDRLEGRDWVAGAYSIADIAIAPWVGFRAFHAIDLDAYPRVAEWYARYEARPAVQRGLAAGQDVWGNSEEQTRSRMQVFADTHSATRAD
jgi:GST-like protein